MKVGKPWKDGHLQFKGKSSQLAGFSTFMQQTTKTKRVFGRPQEFKAQDHFEQRIREPQEKNFGFFLDWGLTRTKLALTVNS